MPRLTFWIAFFGAFVAFTFVPASLNIAVALYFSYVKPPYHSQTGGYFSCVFTSRFLHDRLYGQKRDRGLEIVVLGNSRQFYLASELSQRIGGNPTFLNFAIHNGEPLELSFQYRYLVRKYAFNPRVIVLGVNYDMFFRAVRADRLFLFSPWLNLSLFSAKVSAGAVPNLLPYFSLSRGVSVRSWNEGVKGCGEVMLSDGSIRFVELESGGSVDPRLLSYKREFYKGPLDDSQFHVFRDLVSSILASQSFLLIVDSPQSRELRAMRDTAVPAQYRRYRHFLESLCVRAPCRYLTVEDLGEPEMSDAHFLDGVHANALGVKVMLPRLAREVERALSGR